MGRLFFVSSPKQTFKPMSCVIFMGDSRLYSNPKHWASMFWEWEVAGAKGGIHLQAHYGFRA